ncbi:cytochrome D1 domain-containing protein [uncultured Paenibacillus sp.]|uniref:YVTN family beta-propeller repeat protein n=1 Tax=uncultured Paenibacillus sp. TaxID=227322 RepID=UPI0028D1E3FF|nr:cytochrome D1 domain-containing protein [uncultured Paenibacillus sp.]
MKKRIKITSIVIALLLSSSLLGVQSFISFANPDDEKEMAMEMNNGEKSELTIFNQPIVQTSTKGRILTADEYGNTMTVIDTQTNRVIATTPIPYVPHNIQASPDEKTLWLAIIQPETQTMQGQKMKGEAWVLDADTYKRIARIPVGAHPAHVIVTPDNKEAYITNGEDNSVSVIDTKNYKVIAEVKVGAGPHGLRPSPDGKYVAVADSQGTTVSIIDTAAKKLIKQVEVGKSPVQVGFSPDGKYLFSSVNGDNAAAVIDTQNWNLVKKIPTGVGPLQVYATPNNKYLYVANQNTKERPSRSVTVIDIATLQPIKTIETGTGAHGIVVTADSKLAYVTNIYENTISVIDVEKNEVISTIKSGAGPNGITFLQD